MVLNCSRCGLIQENSKKLYSAFGKRICYDCKANRPKKGTGNSGMSNSEESYYTPSLFDDRGLHLQRVPKSDPMFGKLFFSHYPGSKGIVGRCICYLVVENGKVLGIISGASPPKGYKHFVRVFGANEKVFLNNNAFRLIHTRKNLGTQVLKLFRLAIQADYLKKYGEALLGIVTFVELPRTGSVYKADNWKYLGMTEGIRMRRSGENWEKEFSQGEKKHIFVYEF